MNFFEKQLKKAEQYLRPECFDVCTILSGRTMELVLRELLQKYLQEATPPQRSAVKKEIFSLNKQSPDSLTAGEMAIIFERCNILRGFATVRKINMEDQRLPDFKTMVKIRNKAIHEKVDDADLEKADAHVMYGSVLRLLRITARVAKAIGGWHDPAVERCYSFRLRRVCRVLPTWPISNRGWKNNTRCPLLFSLTRSWCPLGSTAMLVGRVLLPLLKKLSSIFLSHLLRPCCCGGFRLLIPFI